MKIARVLACFLLVAAPHAIAQKTCSPGDAAAAEKALDRVNSWNSLHKAFRDYRHCDSGNVADTFTDALLRLMVDWKNVDSLATSFASDADYKAFIRKHLQSPAAKDDADTVFSRARAQCPSAQKDFCTELAEIVKPGKGSAPVSPAKPSDELDLSPLKPLKTS